MLNNKINSIAIVGLGGVGGYFGFKLAQKYTTEELTKILFVARDSTFRIVAENGLTLLSPEHIENICRPSKIVKSVAELGACDVYLLCVKEYDLEAVCESLKSHLNEKSIILPLMNGADIYERIRKVIPNGMVLPACVYVASHIKEKGVVEHKGKPGKIFVGSDPYYTEKFPEELYQLMKGSGIDIEYRDKVFEDIWMKYLFIASFGLVSACYNKSIGQIAEEPELKTSAMAIMNEIIAIARQKDIRFPDDVIDRTFNKAATFPYDTPTSLQLDVQSKRENNELDLFAGTIIRYGKEFGINVDHTYRIYKMISENVMRNSVN